jgi:putative nucleotidyltransferase with HDIG domain
LRCSQRSIALRTAAKEFPALRANVRHYDLKFLLNGRLKARAGAANRPFKFDVFVIVPSQFENPVADSLNASDSRRAALERLFSRIGEVASLPTAAQKILSLTENPDSSTDELRDAIQGDPVLVARLLRRLNTSYYALSQKVVDLKSAVTLLGTREIRNLALTVFVSRFYEASGTHGTYRRENLWSHCVGVGAAARLVARVCGRGAPEEAFIAGLLHDIGLILLDQSLRRHFHRVIDEINPETPTHIVENRILSFDHALLGGFVARKWNFPEQVAAAITFHHQPWCYTGPHKDLVNVVAVANYLCSRTGLTSLGVHNVAAPPDEVYSGLGLDQVTLAIIWDELDTVLEKATALASA